MKPLKPSRWLSSDPPVVLLTAHDYFTGWLADAAGVDVVLVGDSFAPDILGYRDILQVSLDDMIHHAKAVCHAVRRAPVFVDMPFGSYGVDVSETARNAVRLVSECGCQGVKMAGGLHIVPHVAAVIAQGIPVMGHIGVTTQAQTLASIDDVDGVTEEDAKRLLMEAASLERAGCVSIIAKCIVADVAAEITKRAAIPIISIGSGSNCTGYGAGILYVLGLTEAASRDTMPWFAIRRWDGREQMEQIVRELVTDLKASAIPIPSRE